MIDIFGKARQGGKAVVIGQTVATRIDEQGPQTGLVQGARQRQHHLGVTAPSMKHHDRWARILSARRWNPPAMQASLIDRRNPDRPERQSSLRRILSLHDPGGSKTGTYQPMQCSPEQKPGPPSTREPHSQRYDIGHIHAFTHPAGLPPVADARPPDCGRYAWLRTWPHQRYADTLPATCLPAVRRTRPRH